jgi:glycosyltransferase involved in cell wall biosynthesis
MHNEQNNIILDIAILTYNHKEFIANSINSILSQETNYNYRIIIIDDCSNDGSSKMILDIARENSHKIEYIRNKENLGIMKNALILAEKMKAKYFCFLDGDDYWCYDNKIQNQIDFLEENPDYAGCFHDAKIQQFNQSFDSNYMNRTQVDWKTYSQFNRYTTNFMPWSLIERNIIPTASLIFRRTDILGFLKKYKLPVLSQSWALHLDIIKGSKFKYFNEVWSVYNDHPSGVSKNHDVVDFKINNIKILESLLSEQVWDYCKPIIYRTICEEYRLMLKSKKEISKTFSEYKKSLKQYKKYLKTLVKTDIRQLKNDYFYVRNNGMVE